MKITTLTVESTHVTVHPANICPAQAAGQLASVLRPPPPVLEHLNPENLGWGGFLSTALW